MTRATQTEETTTTDTLADSVARVSAYVAAGPPRRDEIVDGNVVHAQPDNHISRFGTGFVDGVESFVDLTYSDLVAVLNAARLATLPASEGTSVIR